MSIIVPHDHTERHSWRCTVTDLEFTYSQSNVPIQLSVDRLHMHMTMKLE
jgi:hypothetical protein